MLGPSPVAKPIEPRNYFVDFLDKIKHDMEDEDLIKGFHALTENIQRKSPKTTTQFKAANGGAVVLKANKSSPPSSSGRVDPSPSSQPTGFKWTLESLAQNIKAALHINPTNTGAIKDALSLPIKDQLTLLGAITERLLGKNAPVNDRNNTFESVMNILGNLGPEYSDLIYVVTQPLIQQFYNDLPKPFINYVGHSFRTADGSYNSLIFPEVGKSGSNYTRTVVRTGLNNTNLPSAKLVFDKLLRRPEGVFNEHKGSVNMMLLYLAILITHDLFYTDPNDPKRNLTTSYIDLSPLYGFNQENQESVREMKDGLLKPDQWFDKRLVIQPAGVASLLVMFSRNHNYIAKKLLEINENERFSYGPGKRLKSKEEQDEHLFQTARLINNACYANVVIHDYIRTIIGTTADSDFILDPFATPSNPIYGNAVSIEFNVIYRWHAGIGKKDSEWIDQVMSLLMNKMKEKREQKHPGEYRELINKGTQDESLFDQLLQEFNVHFVNASDEELAKGLPIAGAHRDLQTGKFKDTDIIQGLRDGYNQPLSEIGNGRNTPAALEHVEIAGINQARALETCSFNDFRKFLNLTTMKTFADFTEDIEVQKGLEKLYGTPDRVELYVGLMVERTKQTGLRLPYTMGRAILSDAVNLLRNDRILTKEMTPATLTNWGFEYSRGDPHGNNRVFPTLIANSFPDATNAFSSEELRTLFNVPRKQ